MKYFIVFLAITCGVASLAFSVAAEEAASGGDDWAIQICSGAEVLCAKPLALALAAAVLMALWTTLTFAASFGGNSTLNPPGL